VMHEDIDHIHSQDYQIEKIIQLEVEIELQY